MAELRERLKQSLPEAEAGIHFSVQKGDEHAGHAHSATAPKDSGLHQAWRLAIFIVYFTSSIISLHMAQIAGLWLYFVNRQYYYDLIGMTKQGFGLLLSSITQYYCPVIIRVSGDASIKGQLKVDKKGRLVTSFSKRIIMISNHQIYTDWTYYWWIAYTGGMHGNFFIILKESLKYIPIIGPGMILFGFIFLARNWAKDKPRLHHRLNQLNTIPQGGKSLDPMWLLIFPEGTNFCPNGRKSSQKWAAKQNIEDLKHVLLPRATGLQYCLQEVRNTVDWVYDCTIAYEGVGRGQYGQDVFTLRSTYLRGKGPKSLNMYWRRFAIADIPIDDAEAFELWLRERWIEKDKILDDFFDTGRMPEDESGGAGPSGFIENKLQLRSTFEVLQNYLPLIPFGVFFYYLRLFIR